MKFEAPRGTQDVLPAQQQAWENVIRSAEELCAAYGYGRIVTPVFEDTELFARTSGAGSGSRAGGSSSTRSATGTAAPSTWSS